MQSIGSRQPLWAKGAAEGGLSYPPLAGDLTTDVLVIGAGVTGITAAYLLKRAGRRVTLIDAIQPLAGDTGRTTAHLTEILDHRYHVIAHKFGKEGARLAGESQRAAIAQIDALVREHAVDCGFERVPGYLYAETDEQLAELKEEVAAAQRADLDAHFMASLELPFPVKGALRVENQAQVDAVRYLGALLRTIPGGGCAVHGQTRVVDVEDGTPCVVKTDRGEIRAAEVFVAAYVPVSNRFFLITKLAPYRTYAVAARLERPFPRGLYWDMDDPYHYTRRQQMPDGEYLIVGGGDHKVGMEADPRDAMADLKAYVTERYKLARFDHAWSGQIIEPADGLAYIGRNSSSEHVYVATGYSGTGMTWGTLAGMIVTDLIQGRANPYAELYRATRVKPLAMAKEYVSENVDFPALFLWDRLRPPDARKVEEVPPGEGRIVEVDGRKLAVYRSAAGEVLALSPVCTHLGCHVRFNREETSWDCPCHGGRYDVHGRVLNGPPVHGLAAVALGDDGELRDDEVQTERRVEEP